MSEPDIPKILEQLRLLLGGEADIQLRRSVVPDAVDLWVVAANADEILWSPDAAEAGVSLDSPIYGARYVYSSPGEAAESGVVFVEDVASRRRTWATRARVARTSVADEPDAAEPASPHVAVFYSFKGGVGRSTALAQAAVGLARRGRRVLLLDADFEAPSLHTAFGVPDEVSNDRSLVALLDQLAQGIRYGRQADLDVRDYVLRVDRHDELYLMAAGAIDARYVEQVDGLDIPTWGSLPRNPAAVLLSLIAESDLQFDVVLVDARTGLSDTNAPFLLDVVHQYVVCFFPSEQTADGTRLVVRTLIGSASMGHQQPLIRFVASPLPRGAGESVDSTLANRALEWAYEWQFGATDDRQLDLVAIPYDVSVARADHVVADRDIGAVYEPIVDWLDPVEAAPALTAPAAVTAQIRQQLRFTDGTGEGAADDISTLFVRTRDTESAEQDRTLLVLGRKGTGKTTIFLHLLASRNAVAVTEPESVATSRWRPVTATWADIDTSPGGLDFAWPILVALRLPRGRPTRSRSASGDRRLVGRSAAAWRGVPCLPHPRVRL